MEPAKHFIPRLSSEIKRSMLKKMFSSNNIYVDFTTKPTDLIEHAVSPNEEMYKKVLVPEGCFRVSPLVDYKKGDKHFNGCFFYNQTEIVVNTFSEKFNEMLFGMFFVEGNQDCTPLFILPYPQGLELGKLEGIIVNKGHYAFGIAKHSIYGHFGSGNFTPTLEDLMEYENEKEVKGCPYLKPEACVWYKEDKKCAYLREDAICKKVVSLSGQAKIEITSSMK